MTEEQVLQDAANQARFAKADQSFKRILSYGIKNLSVVRNPEGKEVWFEAIGRIGLNGSTGFEFHSLLTGVEIEALELVLQSISERLHELMLDWTPPHLQADRQAALAFEERQ